MKQSYLQRLLPVLTGALLIGFWYWTLSRAWVSPFTLPAPHRILEAIWEYRGEMLDASLATFFAAILGFLSAVAGGFLIAMVLSSNKWIRSSLHPYVLMIQMTPIIVLIPIIGLLIKDPLLRIVLITFLISFFPVAANTILGFTSTDKNLLDLFTVYNATKKQEILFLRIPFAVPYFLTGVKIAGTLAPIGAITGDFLLGTSTNPGLGYRLVTYYSQGETPALFGIALLASLMGFIFVFTVNKVSHFFLKNWHESIPGNP